MEMDLQNQTTKTTDMKRAPDSPWNTNQIREHTLSQPVSGPNSQAQQILMVVQNKLLRNSSPLQSH